MKSAKSLALGLATIVLSGASAGSAVNVVYAGSLVTPMERTVGPAFTRSCACTFAGEGKGSAALANMIEGGIRNPDVFISADTKLMERLRAPGKQFLQTYTVFAKARLVLGHSPKSPFARRFAAAAAGKLSMRALLETPGIRVGRTDPALDPKGVRTSYALGSMHVSPARAPIYPEEDLLVRLESGDMDAAFLYSTESRSRHIPALELPAIASRGHEVFYSIAILEHAANRVGARQFLKFILGGPGQELLEGAGLTYIKKTTR